MFAYTAPADLLHERVILVTGAGDGIGKAAALAYAAHGAHVVLLGRTLRKLEQVYDSILADGHPEPAIYPLNLESATEKEFADLALRVEEVFGRLDGILHNAAFLGALTPIAQYDTALWQRVMQVNLHAPFMLTRACLSLLRQADDAAIIFSADRVGMRGRAYWGAYGASKAAQENLMQTLADELEANTAIRVNSLDPGAVRTAMHARAYPAINPNTLPTPEQVMPAYLYLMGPDCRDLRGQCLAAQATTPSDRP